MRILLAFDKFKGSLSASDACRIASDTVRDLVPTARTEEAPLTDGGEGFVELLTKAADGRIQTCQVTGPLGKPTRAAFGLVAIARLPVGVREILQLPAEGTLAVVEMAQASGLELLSIPDRNPWVTTTRGTGDLLREAAARNPAAIVVGLGGSATHDLGLGALQALGLDATFSQTDPTSEKPSAFVPATWERLIAFSGRIQENLPPIWIASDVDNPLLGRRGAATVFAPQKGLQPADLEELEARTGRIARLLCSHFERDPSILEEAGSGAAGGIGAGLRIACGASLVSGFTLVRSWLDLDRKVAEADLVLTGEGTFDESSLEGKGPGVLVRNAGKNNKRCLVLAGRIEVSEASKREYPTCRFHPISPPGMPVEQAMARGKELLEQAVRDGLKEF